MESGTHCISAAEFLREVPNTGESGNRVHTVETQTLLMPFVPVGKLHFLALWILLQNTFIENPDCDPDKSIYSWDPGLDIAPLRADCKDFWCGKSGVHGSHHTCRDKRRKSME
ncbi:hypothetical protein Anapl_14389 [Anas platyrhynchos]|uniref:Uncharacterized protein n=1 Tax=Anas platyrhynchos TaxID=8839 RepID=R0JXI3_ANAPL|nr:hypothetical protein Anapl_14389 [Anas platyrhynchos]